MHMRSKSRVAWQCGEHRGDRKCRYSGDGPYRHDSAVRTPFRRIPRATGCRKNHRRCTRHGKGRSIRGRCRVRPDRPDATDHGLRSESRPSASGRGPAATDKSWSRRICWGSLTIFSPGLSNPMRTSAAPWCKQWMRTAVKSAKEPSRPRSMGFIESRSGEGLGINGVCCRTPRRGHRC